MATAKDMDRAVTLAVTALDDETPVMTYSAKDATLKAPPIRTALTMVKAYAHTPRKASR